MVEDKFILGENPMSDNNDYYIIHIQDPIFYAKIYEHENKQAQSDFHDEIIKFQEETKASVLVGGDRNFYQPFTLVFLGEIDGSQKMIDLFTKTIREMAEWYQQLIIWEDKHF